jgi:CBS domain containing-hemolysin-like protein
MNTLLLLLLYVGFALGVSFLCSLLEAALLSARISTLSERKSAGSRGAGLLMQLKQTRIDDAISAILILNTLANTLGATLAGAQAARVFGDVWVGLFSGVLTFLILVVSEIIPKTLGASYAAVLSGFVGYTLVFLTRIMAPALLLSRSLTRMLTRGRRTPFSRGELEAIITRASREGALTSDESTLFANLLRFNKVQVGDVMTPRTVTFMMPASSTVDDLLASEEARVFSRIPLYRRDRDDVVGYVLQRDMLHEVALGCDRSRTLESFQRPVWFVPEMITVEAALKQFLDHREPLAMVTDEHGGVAGLVTLEDLTETILGAEIVDELDDVVDLRQAAADYRDRRLERIRKQRSPDGGPAEV